MGVWSTTPSSEIVEVDSEESVYESAGSEALTTDRDSLSMSSKSLSLTLPASSKLSPASKSLISEVAATPISMIPMASPSPTGIASGILNVLMSLLIFEKIDF